LVGWWVGGWVAGWVSGLCSGLLNLQTWQRGFINHMQRLARAALQALTCQISARAFYCALLDVQN
jgi:hypothetical protein